MVMNSLKLWNRAWDFFNLEENVIDFHVKCICVCYVFVHAMLLCMLSFLAQKIENPIL